MKPKLRTINEKYECNCCNKMFKSDYMISCSETDQILCLDCSDYLETLIDLDQENDRHENI